MAVRAVDVVTGELPSRVDHSPLLPPARHQQGRMTCARFAVAGAAEACLGLGPSIDTGYLSVEHLVSQVGDVGFFANPLPSSVAEKEGRRHGPAPREPTGLEKLASRLQYSLSHPALVRTFSALINPPLAGRLKSALGGKLEARVFSGRELVQERYWPYQGAAQPGLGTAPRWKIDGVAHLPMRDPVALKSYLASSTTHNIVTALYITPEDDTPVLHPKHGVLRSELTRSTLVAHVVLMVGYEERVDEEGVSRTFFKFRNSRGPDWGEDGYGWVSEDYLRSFGVYTAHLTGVSAVNT